MRSSTSKVLRDIKKKLVQMNKLGNAMLKCQTPTAWQEARMKELEDEWKRLCQKLPQF